MWVTNYEFPYISWNTRAGMQGRGMLWMKYYTRDQTKWPCLRQKGLQMVKQRSNSAAWCWSSANQCNETCTGHLPIEKFWSLCRMWRKTAGHWRSVCHGGQNELNHRIKGKNSAKSEVLTQLLLKINVFWDISQCLLVITFRRFEGSRSSLSARLLGLLQNFRKRKGKIVAFHPTRIYRVTKGPVFFILALDTRWR